MENQNLKNHSNGIAIFKIILTIVTILCVIVGLWINIVGDFAFSPNSRSVTESEIDMTEEMNASKIQKISVDADIAEFNMKQGDRFVITYMYPRNDEPKVELKDGTLYVTYNTKKKVSHSFKNQTYSITITIPKDFEIGELDVDVDAGEVTLDGLFAGSVSIHADAGSIGIANCSWKDTSITADVGSVEMETSSFEKISVKADCGSIDLNDVTFRDADLKADLGSIEVSGTFDKIEAKCSLGSIEVNTTKDLSEIVLDLDADMGSIEVNGEDWK